MSPEAKEKASELQGFVDSWNKTGDRRYLELFVSNLMQISTEEEKIYKTTGSNNKGLSSIGHWNTGFRKASGQGTYLGSPVDKANRMVTQARTNINNQEKEFGFDRVNRGFIVDGVAQPNAFNAFSGKLQGEIDPKKDRLVVIRTKDKLFVGISDPTEDGVEDMFITAGVKPSAGTNYKVKEGWATIEDKEEIAWLENNGYILNRTTYNPRYDATRQMATPIPLGNSFIGNDELIRRRANKDPFINEIESDIRTVKGVDEVFGKELETLYQGYLKGAYTFAFAPIGGGYYPAMYQGNTLVQVLPNQDGKVTSLTNEEVVNIRKAAAYYKEPLFTEYFQQMIKSRYN